MFLVKLTTTEVLKSYTGLQVAEKRECTKRWELNRFKKLEQYCECGDYAIEDAKAKKHTDTETR